MKMKLDKLWLKIKRIYDGQCTDCGRSKVDWWGATVCPYCGLCPAGSSKTYKELDDEKLLNTILGKP